ncbi:hypothetical protein NKI20_07580 [Mesorhizobium sp. M0830]
MGKLVEALNSEDADVNGAHYRPYHEGLDRCGRVQRLAELENGPFIAFRETRKQVIDLCFLPSEIDEALRLRRQQACFGQPSDLTCNQAGTGRLPHSDRYIDGLAHQINSPRREVEFEADGPLHRTTYKIELAEAGEIYFDGCNRSSTRSGRRRMSSSAICWLSLAGSCWHRCRGFANVFLAPLIAEFSRLYPMQDRVKFGFSVDQSLRA